MPKFCASLTFCRKVSGIVKQHEVRAISRGVGEILRHQLAGKINGRWMLFPQDEQLFARERCAAAGGTGEGESPSLRVPSRAPDAPRHSGRRFPPVARAATRRKGQCRRGALRPRPGARGGVERHPPRTQAGGETREKRKPVRIRIGLKVRQHALKAALDAFRDDGAAERVDAWDRPGAAVGKAMSRRAGRPLRRSASGIRLTDGIGHVDERQCGP